MNKEVFDKLLTTFHENKLAHAYLFETKDVDSTYNDVITFIKKILCSQEYEDDCKKCEICHLIDEGNMPSIITVEPDGKSIKTDAIENLKRAFSLMPLYIPYNIYIIKYPEKMNDTAFNKMLKFLEEPEDNILGFYITNNKDSVANTIVSRCELIKLFSNDVGIETRLSEEDYSLCKNIAREYYKKLENYDNDITWYNTTTILKELTNQEQIVCLLNLIYNTYEAKFHESKDFIIVKKLKIIEKYLSELNYNMNTSLLLDSFVLEMGEVDGK